MTTQFKGGKFINRYLIKTTLTALSSFHIGDGKTTTRKGMTDKEREKLKINAIVTDAHGKAYIPGSSLRGAMRDWLRQAYEAMSENLDDETAKEKINDIRNSLKEQKEKDKELLAFIIEKVSTLDRVFGTQYNEGKLEVWDAYCASEVVTPTKDDGLWCGWDKDRLTYVAKSVAINPETGTADDGKLYNYELVPSGAMFKAIFSAQNLSPEEAALLLAILNGFNHKNNPIVLGAMTKLDFGRFKISEEFKIYRVDSTNLATWRNLAENEKNADAGYDSIARKEFELKKEEREKLEVTALPVTKSLNKHAEELTFTLETPMVIRSGSSAGWKNAAKSKTRNYKMEFKWDATPQELENRYDRIGDLYHSLKIVGDQPTPYYHIPSSSIRGALRAWTIKRLLPQDWWDIEKKLKEGAMTNLPPYFDNILSLFGFAIEGADKKITRNYTKAGRLTIRVAPFENGQVVPAVDGNDWENPSVDNFGPANAARHVKPRNPLDRITHAAKEGGLHNFLEFSRGQELVFTIEIREPKEFDLTLLERWKVEINSGMIRFGGLTGIGRGRVMLKKEEVIPHGEE